MVKTAALALRIDPALKVALEKAARADGRSLSSLVQKIIEDWLAANRQGKRRR